MAMHTLATQIPSHNPLFLINYIRGQNIIIVISTYGIDYFTALDFSHITFAQRGLSSTQPLPAGMFRSGDETKYVMVRLLDELPDTKIKKIELELDVPEQAALGKSVEGHLLITNPNNFAVLNVLVNLR